MPGRNIIKTYVENGYYHLYNRGVEKRKIFLDDRDYKTFLFFLKRYLSPIEPRLEPNEILHKVQPLKRLDLSQEIKLLAYGLMPNHFHLLIKQKIADGITKLTRCVATSYSIYFNKRYERTGSLFQGNYKAVLVETDEQLLHLSRYMHLNILENKQYPLRKMREILLNSYSSYGDYLGIRRTAWVHPEEILAFFKTAKRRNLKDILSYQSFVEDYAKEAEEMPENLTLE